MNRIPSASSSKKRPRASAPPSRVRARHEDGDERGREEEARRIDPEGGGGAEARDEHASERRAQERRSLLDRRPDAARTLHGHPGRLDDVREERRARGGSRRVEQRAEEHERHQLPELDPDRRVQEGDGGDGAGARQVSHDARCTEPETIDDHAAEEPGEHDREEVEEDGEPGEGRAPGRHEDVPGDRELRDRVPGQRDRVGGVQRVERRPLHGGRLVRTGSRTAKVPAQLPAPRIRPQRRVASGISRARKPHSRVPRAADGLSPVDGCRSRPRRAGGLRGRQRTRRPPGRPPRASTRACASRASGGRPRGREAPGPGPRA